MAALKWMRVCGTEHVREMKALFIRWATKGEILPSSGGVWTKYTVEMGDENLNLFNIECIPLLTASTENL